ncbi:LuxR family transcriptional regulator [Cupriavidus sp. USMAHM13]|uniref:autoinducer binding domain-containing protein n=1 Tax=Cupriavidus sp. USMAHM13 TaxID=1389192 RepID=UPI0008A6AE68|nr:autoinducer binding domain-containing protein [Cupriavidus sp. USMAHM13]AOZ02126.1 LuxR family transcriptional regulator [Cupriavidus sp. USMAHM13]
MSTPRWQEELIVEMEKCTCAREAFHRIERATNALGFDMFAVGIRTPLPLSRPRTTILSNFPTSWQARYKEANYLSIDPTVAHGRRTTVPLVWTDDVFATTPALWVEAQAVGLRVGWCQSCFSPDGVGSMLSLVRCGSPISASELECNESKMRTLVSVAHLALSRLFDARPPTASARKLTCRETEILRWAADGKTSGEIACILNLSVDTVNFHMKNAVRKLDAPNKTGAVVRAAMLGLLHH